MKPAQFFWLPVRLAMPFWNLARALVEMRYPCDRRTALPPLAAQLPEIRIRRWMPSAPRIGAGAGAAGSHGSVTSTQIG